MEETVAHVRCLSCAKGEHETPLVILQFGGKKIHICPQCLPVLIHHPEKIVEKVASA
jgi:hypothetical protein